MGKRTVIVTKSDAGFFPGLVALLNSLACHTSKSVVVLDCGLTREQRSWCTQRDNVSEVIDVDLSGFLIARLEDQGKFTPAIYGLFQFDFSASDVVVHIDADAIVLEDIDPLEDAALIHGIAAIPDYPPLDLAHQIGSEATLDEVSALIGPVDPLSVAFNAGVIALRSNYYMDHMKQHVNALFPIHTRLWGNDQAVLNLAAYAANPKSPFYKCPQGFNARPRYSRAPDAPPLCLNKAKTGATWGSESVTILHFVGRSKPWHADYHESCPGRSLWDYYYGLEAPKRGENPND